MSELGVDGIRQGAGRGAAPIGAQAAPIEGVVPHLSRVIEQAAAGSLDDLFQALAFVLGARNHVVQVHNVGVVMLAMVNLHGQRVDVRLQGVLGVR